MTLDGEQLVWKRRSLSLVVSAKGPEEPSQNVYSKVAAPSSHSRFVGPARLFLRPIVLLLSAQFLAIQIITTDPNPDVKKQIVRELNFNRDCASEHICRYYGAFVDHSTGTISIAMEYCEGGSLDSVYREVKKLGGRTGEKVLGKVAEGVLGGLTYLHGQKIIHRGKCGPLRAPLVGFCRGFCPAG